MQTYRSFSRLAAGLVLVLFICAGSLSAQVSASLVAAQHSVQPGRPLRVALRLVHEPRWHTYWLNAGTGYPTKITWQLPDGWTASEIQWPVPHVIRDTHGVVTGHGYNGDLLLAIILTPPADLKSGEPVILRAHVVWLMCADTCVPGESDVALPLPVSNDTPLPDAQWTAALETRHLPETAHPWSLSAIRRDKSVVLTLTGGGTKPENPHFFCANDLIAYDEPQLVSAHDNRLEITLPLSATYSGTVNRLAGVLSFGTEDGASRGIAIDTEISAAPAAATANAHASTAGLLPTLALAFVGGLILNLMPCVFPVLGIKILGFVSQAGANRRKVTLHGLVFAAGVLASFWTLAALLAVLRAGGDQLGWGFQLQSPGFVFVLTAVMLVFGLSMSGVFEFGLRATSVGSGLQSKDGYSGSFFTGVLATVVATPCSAPFLAPALGAALALNPAAAFTVFTAIALGLSTPYLLLSVFPGAVKVLPRPGAWMETFKQIMAFPLYGTVGYLIWVLGGQLGDAAYLNTLLGLTLVAMAAWLYGRYTAPGAKPARVRFGFLGGATLLALGALLGWPRPAETRDIVWGKWSPEAVVIAQRAGKPVYVDFTARWCATCQANKRLVLGSDKIKQVFRERGVVALKADWTSHDPLITAELAKYGRSAVPFNLVYPTGLTQPTALPELLTPQNVLSALR